MIKKSILSALLILFALPIAAQDNCDFFDLLTPKKTPQDFNPKELELDDRFNFNIEIKTCNEVYFTTIVGGEVIYYSERKNGQWSKPEIASFSDPNYNDADPFLSEDGGTIYFISKRPTGPGDENLDWNIWSAQRENGQWKAPKPLPAPINGENSDEYFFSISDRGNAYFSSNRKGGEGSFDIYTTNVLGNNQFSKPVNAGRPLSTEKYEFDPYICPDESFIVFSINENGNSSLFVSHRDEDNKWTIPRNLGEQINITNQDFAPSLSADGKYLFFSNDGKLKWVSAEILEVIKE